MLKQTDSQMFVTRKPQQLSIVQNQRLSSAQADQLSRVQLALAIPRDWDEVRGLLLNDCKDPEFASEAIYVRPGDPPIKGLSIRFAERARQHMRNVEEATIPEFNDEREASYTLVVIDLENNSKASETFTVSKVANKLSAADDEIVLEEKVTTRGTIYVVESSEEDFAARRGAIRSKVRRGLLLGLLPAEIKNACLLQCIDTMSSAVQSDPNAAKNVLQEFLVVGVDAADLKEFLGKPISGATPEEIVELRTILTSVRQGETRWEQAVAARKQIKAKVSAAEAFAEQKRQEKEKAKQQRVSASTGGASGRPQAGPAGAEAPSPVRRSRKPKTQAPAVPVSTGSTAGSQISEATPPPAPPRASRRDEEEDDEEPYSGRAGGDPDVGGDVDESDGSDGSSVDS